ncbi:hypothetical protein HD554DRAFT_2172776 [Boletus coccyginus]|nr:hypothetical protein HD554DRAFT_2172776 [Boletus coccyginus]
METRLEMAATSSIRQDINRVMAQAHRFRTVNAPERPQVAAKEEHLAQITPDQVNAAPKQNVSAKVEVQRRGLEPKKLKSLVLELERKLERSQKECSAASSRYRERDLEAKLQEREHEIRQLWRGRVSTADEDTLLRAELRNEEPEEELDHRPSVSARLLRVAAMTLSMGGETSTNGGSGSWRSSKEELVDEIAQLDLEIEDIQQRRKAEPLERSESQAQVLEAREEREAVEEDLNSMRDKLAATMIELSQKEDEI